MKRIAACLLAALSLTAQVPSGWNQRTALGSDLPDAATWYGAGLWSGDHHGPAATLTDSLGMGNALTGGGFHLEGGFRRGNWDMAAEVLGNRDDQGHAYLTLYRSHLWYRGDHGWQGGFEQEPLVWGYGLNGGYMLGQAARPFPRLRVESPMADLHFFRIPLGTWGWQAFMGRMENHPVLSSSIQDPSNRSRLIANQGNPEAPFLMGYRVQAEFGPLMEFYLNYLNLWGGTLDGQAMTSGYDLKEYLTAITGLKDSLAEANTDFNSANPTAPVLRNGAKSASEIDVGFRLLAPAMAQALAARTVQMYVSRGSKSELWPVGVFVKNPVRYLGKDVSKDLSNFLSPNWAATWTQDSRYAAPSLSNPNDTVGVLVSWSGVRFGLEYFNYTDSAAGGNRPFASGTYATGFYYYGDPLGNAVGGEAIATTAKLEVDISSRLTTSTSLMRGHRPFRDDPSDWQLDHPGQTPGKNRFTSLQQGLTWKPGAITTLDLGAAWQRQSAVEYVTGASGNGFSWYTDLSFHWPARP